jgi:hypothetical protein
MYLSQFQSLSDGRVIPLEMGAMYQVKMIASYLADRAAMMA